jgi:hypothetical protein
MWQSFIKGRSLPTNLYLCFLLRLLYSRAYQLNSLIIVVGQVYAALDRNHLFYLTYRFVPNLHLAGSMYRYVGMCR